MSPRPHPFATGPGRLAIAHRGGALLPENLGKENSVEAFANAVALGYTHLETDLRTTRDGEVFAFHDPDLRRVVGQEVRFSDLSAEEVRALRLRGGARIPSLDDLLAEFPEAVFNLDVKDDASVDGSLERIARRDAAERVVLASFSHQRLQRVRAQAPHLATSATRAEVITMILGGRPRGTPAPVAVQIPERHRGFPILSRPLVERAHRWGMHVHVWTVDAPGQMHRLLDLGVDGLITDRPDRLKDVLLQRGQWPA